MRNLIALKEQRATKVDALRAIHSKAASENRDLTDAEQSAFDAGKAEVEKIERELRNAEFLAEVERRAEAEPVGERHGDMAELEARFSASKALSEFVETGRLTGAEAEYAAEHRSGRPGAIAMPTSVFLGGEHRVLKTTTPGAGPGSNLIATNQGAFIDRVRPTLVTESLGATVMRGLVGNFELPKMKESGTAGWIAEHTDAPRSDPKFGKVAMSPKTVAAEYEVSRRMLLQATALEPILRNDLSFLLRQALDTAAIRGGGTNEPVGILATPGLTILPLGTNGGELNLDITADMIGAIDDDAEGSRGFLITPRIRTAAMKLRDTNEQPYGVNAVFHNEPVKVSKALPTDGTKGTGTNLEAMVYGIWSDLIVGYWSAVDLVPNPYHSDVASKGGLLLHAFLDADVAVRHIESFVAATDVVTA